jgi:DNA polymerase-3 subunit beta
MVNNFYGRKMQLCIERNTLLKALSRVQSIVEKKHTVAILANVKIECNGNTVSLSATDMDILVRENLIIQGHIENSAITVPVHTLHEIVRKLPDGSQIDISQLNESSEQVEVISGLSRFSLPCISATEFPNFEAGNSISQFNIDGNILRTLLTKTKHAISFDETRYYLTGVYFHAAETEGNKVLRAVTTDTHRLAQSETYLPAGAENIPGIIIPRKTTFELIRLLEGHTGDIEMQIASNKVTFTIGETTLISRLIDGKFPNYSAVIPLGHDKKLEVYAKELAKAIDLVISVSLDRTRSVRLKIESGKITIAANSSANGNASGSEVLDANYEGQALNIGFNAKYILDALSAIDENKVVFSIGDEGSAVVVQTPEDSSTLQVLMPMQG